MPFIHLSLTPSSSSSLFFFPLSSFLLFSSAVTLKTGSLGEELQTMFLSYSDNFLRDAQLSKEQIELKASLMEEVSGFCFAVLFCGRCMVLFVCNASRCLVLPLPSSVLSNYYCIALLDCSVSTAQLIMMSSG